MKNFLFNISEEERKNILDKHKTLYDGYAVRQNVPNTQPLYVQDLANDKEGITVNGNGEVSSYNNKVYMKESKNICSECGLYEDVCECGKGGMYETECKECGGIMKEGECTECGYKMGDISKSDSFDYVEEQSFEAPKIINTEAECDECGKGGMYEKEIDEILDEIEEEIEFKEETESIKESIQESLSWFKKFENYN